VDTEGRDVTFEYGNFDVLPKTEIPTSTIKTPFGNTDVRFVFSEKRKGWEYQTKDPKSIEWTTRAFTIGEFTENSKWESPRTPEEIVFIVELATPPITFGLIYDQDKNRISNDRVYQASPEFYVRKDQKGRWELVKFPIFAREGVIVLSSDIVEEIQKFAESKVLVRVQGFQEREIIFNPKILSNKAGELPLNIIMDRVTKVSKKKEIKDGLPAKLDNVSTKLNKR
jgi:hypothetical protein